MSDRITIDQRDAALRSFLPPRLAARLEDHAASGTTSVRGDAAVMFSDISGFTRLAEKLIADGGLDGMDRLTDLLNHQFGRWVELVAEHGGEVVKFAGDALLAVWWADDHSNLASAASTATGCALAIQDSMAGQSRVEGIPLSLRVGLGAGIFEAARVGGVRGRWELVAGGPVMSQIAPTLQHAARGSVVASPEAWALCENLFHGRSDDMGTTITGTHSSLAPVSSISDEPAPTGDFRRYLPRIVKAHLDSDLDGFLAEHRLITVLFVHFDGLSVEEDGWSTKLHDALVALQSELYSGGGALDKVSVDDKGVTIVAAFGLPSADMEYRPDEGVRAAVRINDRLDGMDLPTSVGVTSGKVFCGPIGSDLRREYTIIGRTVNLAARLMSSAGGDVVVDEETHRVASGAATFEALAPLVVKGFEKDVARFRPVPRVQVGPSVKASDRIQLIGRGSEIDALLAELSSAERQESKVVLLTGEPGIGKSRLVGELISRLQQRGIAAQVSTALPTLRDTPYSAWREILPRTLGLPGGDESDARRELLQLRLAQDADRAALLPLLDPILDLGLEDNEATSPLEGQARGDSARALLLSLLADRAESRPMALIFEDGQWFDAGSAELVEEIARAEIPLTVLVTARGDRGTEDALGELAAIDRVVHQELRSLGLASVEELIKAEMRATAVSRTVASWLWERTDGNPFFCLELLVALQHQGALSVRGGCVGVQGDRSLNDLDIPATVEGLVVGRLDRLAPLQQLVLKTAAVIGTDFRTSDLERVLPDRARGRDVGSALDAIQTAGLIERLDAPDRVAWTLRQGIVRDVAYNSLISGQRRDVHRAVAGWLEEEHADALDAVYTLLAHHWSGARELPPTVRYLELAGDQALHAGVAEEAAGFFERALELADRFPDEVESVTTNLQRTRWRRKLARANVDQAKHTEADQLIRRALSDLGHSLPTSDGGFGRLLLTQLIRQHLNRTLPSMFVRPPPTPDESLAEASELVWIFLELVYWEYQSPVVFPAISLWSLNLREKSGAQLRHGDLSNVGMVLGGMGMGGVARKYFERSRNSEAVDYLDAYYGAVSEAMHHALNTRWEEAEPALDAMHAAPTEVGNERLIANAQITRAFCRLYQGRVADALALFDRSIQVAVRLGQRRDEFNDRVVKAIALLDAGRVDAATAEITRARSALPGDRPVEAETWLTTLAALVAAQRTDWPLVLEEGEKVLALVGPKPRFDLSYVLQFHRLSGALLDALEASGADPARLRAAAKTTLGLLAIQGKAMAVARPGLQVMRGRLARLNGKSGAARKLVRKGLSMAVDGAMYLDEAAARVELARLPGTVDAEEQLRQAAELLEQYGAEGQLKGMKRLPAPSVKVASA